MNRLTKEKIHEQLFEQLTDGYIVAQDRKIFFVNKILQAVTGYSELELMGADSSILIVPELRESFLATYNDCMAGGEAPELSKV